MLKEPNGSRAGQVSAKTREQKHDKVKKKKHCKIDVKQPHCEQQTGRMSGDFVGRTQMQTTVVVGNGKLFISKNKQKLN